MVASHKVSRRTNKPLLIAVGLITLHLPLFTPRECFDADAMDSTALPQEMTIVHNGSETIWFIASKTPAIYQSGPHVPAQHNHVICLKTHQFVGKPLGPQQICSCADASVASVSGKFCYPLSMMAECRSLLQNKNEPGKQVSNAPTTPPIQSATGGRNGEDFDRGSHSQFKLRSQ